MYVRKRKNQSGSYSVLLCVGERREGKKNPTSRMIKSFGSTSDEQHLQKLLAEAEAYKLHLQSTLPRTRTLRISSDLDFKSCKSYNVGFHDVYGNAFDQIFKSISIKDTLLNQLKDITIMRIAEPCSKRRTAKIAAKFNMSCSADNIYKIMDKLDDTTTVAFKKEIYLNTAHILADIQETVDVLFYDLTTVYFETNIQNEIRDFGFSKDGKHQHVQIMLAVIVTKEGLPIDYEEFPGNTYEGHTLLPVINKIKDRYNIDNVVIVADAALMNKINMQDLDNQGIKYIIAAKIKNVKDEIKKSILDIGAYKIISSFSDKETGKYDEIKSKIIPCETGDNIFAYYSTKRARKDEYDRIRDLEKIRKHIDSTAKSKLTGSLRKSYVKVSKNCKIEIDHDKLQLVAQYDGFFGLRTNIKDANPIDILNSYRGLWQVEQTFRIAKSNLEIRPVFHYTPRRIRAHFLICYIALSLVRCVEFKLKTQKMPIPCDELHILLSEMSKTRIIDSDNNIFELIDDPPEQMSAIYHALNIKWYKKFQPIIKL